MAKTTQFFYNTVGLSTISANGTVGSAGQVLYSNGTGVYWANVATTMTAGLGLGSNSTAYFVVANTGIVANATGTYVNAAYIATITSNNATYFNGFTWDSPAALGGTVANTARFTTVTLTGGINANGSIGAAGQVLTSNGSVAYWTTPTTGTVTNIASGNGLTGGPITSTGTLSVVANSGLVSNSTGVFVNANTGIVANTTGVFVNSAYIATLSANNTTYLNGQLASYYLNATNINAGTIGAAFLPQANATSNGAVMILDSVTNTSIAIYAASANSVKTAYDAAIAANTRATSAQTAAISAYSNAVAYAAANTYVNTTFAPKASPTFTGTLSAADVAISGNLTVSGTTTYINTNNLNIGDAIISLNADITAATPPTEDGGIEINRGSSANVQFIWDETNDRWSTNTQPFIAGNTTSTGFVNVASDSASLRVGNSSVFVVTNSTAFSGTANNSLFLGGYTWAAPAVIGGTTPNTATFTSARTQSNSTVYISYNENGGNTTHRFIRSQGSVAGATGLALGSENNSTTVLYAHNGNVELQPGPYHGSQGYVYSVTDVRKSMLDGTSTTSFSVTNDSYAWVNNTSTFTTGRIIRSVFSNTNALEYFRAEANAIGIAQVAVGGAVLANVRMTLYTGRADYNGLTIRGSASQTSSLLDVQNSGASSLLFVAANGNVGIGNSTPAEKFVVAGDAATMRLGNSTVTATVNATNYTGTANNTVNLNGVAASNYTRVDLTNLGQTSTYTLDSATNTATLWGALPVGYAKMMNGISITTTGGTPDNYYGYFMKTGRRDSNAGWAGIWCGFNSGNNYIGRSLDGTSLATWERIWTDANDGVGSGLDAGLFAGQLPAYYTNATNITTGTLPYAQIPANVTNTTANFSISGIWTHSANVVLGAAAGLSANGTYGTAGQTLTSNGTTTYWSTPAPAVNAAAQYTWSNTHTFQNTVTYGGSTTIAANGFVGVGTATPNFQLDVVASANAVGGTIRSYNSNTGSNAAVAIQQQTTTVTGVLSTTQTGTFIGTTTAHPVSILANNATTAYFAANNSVGIGTSAPGYQLDVVGNAIRIASGASAGYAAVQMGRSATASQNWHLVSEGDGNFRLYNGNLGAGTGRMLVSSAGNITAGSDFRAPIFYDSDNTGYFINPAGTSYVNIMQLDNTGAILFNDRGRDVATVTLPNWLNRSIRWDFVTSASAGTGGSYAGVMTFVPWDGNTASTGDASYQLVFGGTAANGGGVPQLRIRKGIDTTWNSFYNIHHDGYADMFATGSFRAPVFYDSDNTGWYVNPNGTSVMNVIQWGSPVNTGGGQWQIGSTAWSGNPPGSTNTNSSLGVLYTGGTGSQVFTFGSGPGNMSIQLDGSVFVGDSITYNPISASGSTAGCVVAQGSISTQGNLFINGYLANLRAVVDTWHNSNDGTNRFYFGNGGRSYYKSADGHEFRSSADGNISFLDNGGTFYNYNSVRSPIFYDQDNTGYFFDGTSTTRIAGELQIITNSNQMRLVQGSYGLIFRQDGSNFYLLPTNSADQYGSWNSLRPLQVELSTGILKNSHQIHAPIFYDIDDTSTYVNPNGSSWFKGHIYMWRAGASNDTFGGLEIRENDGVTNTQSAASYAPGINFHWSNRAAARFYMDSGGSFVLGGQSDITNNRRTLFCNELYASGQVVAYYSDERLKTKLGNINGAVGIIKQLSGFRYVNNELANSFGYTDKSVQLGVSAQDVEKVLPELVKHAAFDVDNNDPEYGSKTGEWYKTVQYDRLVPVLIEAVKEQQLTIEDQAAKLAKLEAMVESLINKLEG